MEGKKKSLHFKALLASVIGFLVMLGLLNFMNATSEKRKKQARAQVQFKTKKLKAKDRQKLQPKKRKKRRKQKASTLKPKMNMAFMNSGLDLGIDILGLSTGESRLFAQEGDKAMTEDIVDQLPEVQYREPIPYPDFAKEKNINGHVTVNILVGKSGSVEKVNLVDSYPEGVFDQAAVQAVREWSFSPAKYKGRIVAVWVKQKLKFQVN